MADNAYGIQSTADLPMHPGYDQYSTRPADYYDKPADFWMAVAYERAFEWDYDADPHGYCHDRSVLVGLLREIERLRAAVRTEPEGYRNANEAADNGNTRPVSEPEQ